MGLKKCGALWMKKTKKDQDFLAGRLDLGIMGEVDVMIFQNEFKENEKSPNMIINLVVNEDDGR